MGVLTTFAELPPEANRNLLLGNGFSSAIFPAFRYESLLGEAKRQGLFGPDVEAVFEEFGTHDFEYVLSQLWTCVRVSRHLGLETSPFSSRYDLVRESLAKAVKAVHPRHDSLKREALAACAKKLRERYSGVFTLNYDLLLYWMLAADSFDGVGDFFWSSDLRFDPASCSERENQLPIFYLHGALFLSSDEEGTSKLKSDWGRNLLEQVEDRWKEGKVPIFVSEGTWEQKARAIRRDPYLSFALGRLSRIQEGLTAFGASFGESDRHIVQAVTANPSLRTIAVSIRGESEEELGQAMRRIEGRLVAIRQDVALHFYKAEEFVAALSLPEISDAPHAAIAAAPPAAGG